MAEKDLGYDFAYFLHIPRYSFHFIGPVQLDMSLAEILKLFNTHLKSDLATMIQTHVGIKPTKLLQFTEIETELGIVLSSLEKFRLTMIHQSVIMNIGHQFEGEKEEEEEEEEKEEDDDDYDDGEIWEC